ncbi:MAG: prolyl oligopeptidase family serine peptidase [Pseudomonadota bacterium]
MRRSILIFLLIANSTGTVLAKDSTKKPSVKDFASPADVSSVTLSPNGRFMASIVRVDTNDLQGQAISVLDTDAMEAKIQAGTDNSTYRYQSVNWLNDNALLVKVNFPSVRYGKDAVETRHLSMDIETGKMDSILPEGFHSRRGQWVPQHQGYVVDFMRDDPDHFLYASRQIGENGQGVYMISLKGDKPVEVQRPVNYLYGWVADQQSRIRLGISSRVPKRSRIMIRDLGKESFRNLWIFDMDSEDRIVPMGFDEDPNILYFKAKQDGKWAVYKTNVNDPELTRELVYFDPEDDYYGDLIYSVHNKRVVGIHRGTGKGFHIWDPDYDRLYKSINKALGDYENYFYAFSKSEQRFLVLSSSDVESGSYFLWDREAKRVDLLAFHRQALKPEMMLKQNHTQFTARDGTERPIIHTFHPDAAASPRPSIIMVSSSPGSRFSRGFQLQAQFLASRGYNVAQVNMRNSDNYAPDGEPEGILGWGSDSLKDIVDVAKWLVDNKIAGAENVCVMGRRFGGSMALLASTSEEFEFKCVASIAGITDLREYLRQKRDYSGYRATKWLVGDRLHDSLVLSPKHVADKIDVPVLLVHGTKDRTVHPEQSTQLFETLKSKGTKVQYIELEGAHHEYRKSEDRMRVYEGMEEFFERSFSERSQVSAKSNGEAQRNQAGN